MEIWLWMPLSPLSNVSAIAATAHRYTSASRFHSERDPATRRQIASSVPAKGKEPIWQVTLAITGEPDRNVYTTIGGRGNLSSSCPNRDGMNLLAQAANFGSTVSIAEQKRFCVAAGNRT